MSTLNARDGAFCANTVGRTQQVAAFVVAGRSYSPACRRRSMTTFCLVDFLWATFVVLGAFAFDSFRHCVDCGLCGSPSISLFSRHPADFTSADVGDSNARPNVAGLARRTLRTRGNLNLSVSRL